MKKNLKRGFTLIELLIVITVISILGAVAFVAIDPATRINQAQDSERWSAANALMDAFLNSTVDNDGTYPAGVSANGTVHMIATTSGACTVSGCTDTVTTCTDFDDSVSDTDFDDLVNDGYIADLPVDPDGNTSYGSAQGGTGYTLSVNTTGIVTVTACGAETDTIEVAR